VPVVDPEGTTHVVGTVTVGLRSEVRATEKPAGGAAALIVTVPTVLPPPYDGLGATEKPVRLIAVIVSVALCELVPTDAVIDAVVFAPDVWVVLTVNVADVEPAGMLTEAPTEADVELEARFTVVAVACLAEMVTVPVEE